MERLTIDKVIDLVTEGNQIRKHINIKLAGMESVSEYDLAQIEVLELLKELKSYREAKEKGLLLELPCKVGQTVYAFAYPRTDIAVVVEEEVEKFLVWENGMSIETDGGYYPLDEIGVYVFLTKEEAEQALEKMKEV